MLAIWWGATSFVLCGTVVALYSSVLVSVTTE